MNQNYTSAAQLWQFMTNVLRRSWKSVVVNAGHIVLLYDARQDAMVVGIPELLTATSVDRRRREQLSHFTTMTLTLGSALAAESIKQDNATYMTLLINDWLDVPADNQRSEDQPNRYRSEFYERLSELPAPLKEIASDAGLSDDIWIGGDQDTFFFREVRLQERFKRKSTGLVKRGLLLEECKQFDKRTAVEEFRRIRSCHVAGEKIDLVRGSKASCAGEIAQFTIELVEDVGADLIINILPFECMCEVNGGIMAVTELYNLESLSVINVFPDNESEDWKQNDFVVSTLALENSIT